MSGGTGVSKGCGGVRLSQNMRLPLHTLFAYTVHSGYSVFAIGIGVDTERMPSTFSPTGAPVSQQTSRSARTVVKAPECIKKNEFVWS